jgi:hypothetical protein
VCVAVLSSSLAPLDDTVHFVKVFILLYAAKVGGVVRSAVFRVGSNKVANVSQVSEIEELGGTLPKHVEADVSSNWWNGLQLSRKMTQPE